MKTKEGWNKRAGLIGDGVDGGMLDASVNTDQFGHFVVLIEDKITRKSVIIEHSEFVRIWERFGIWLSQRQKWERIIKSQGMIPRDDEGEEGGYDEEDEV